LGIDTLTTHNWPIKQPVLVVNGNGDLIAPTVNIGVQDLRSVVVDNAWNESAEESARSLANGKARLIDMTEWFLA
jgi:hypothetical protein